MKIGDTVTVGHAPGLIKSIGYGVAEVQTKDGCKLLPLERLSDARTFDGNNLKAIAPITKEDQALLRPYMPLDASLDGYKVVTMVAADNLLDRGWGRWNPDDLVKLSKLPLGFPMLMNHDGQHIQSIQGTVFDSGVVRYENVSTHFTKTADNYRYNRDIVQREGYQAFIIRAAIPDGSALFDNPSMMNYVSLGYSFKDLHCPLCNVSFMDASCPHQLPTGSRSREREDVAPWYEKKDPFDIYELSFVPEPNLPRAGIIRGVHKGLQAQ